MAREINENIREYENEQRVIAIGRRLVGKDLPPIAIPGRRCVLCSTGGGRERMVRVLPTEWWMRRRIIKEGWLEKRSRQEPGKKNWRYTFLFNDIMVYSVAMEDKYAPQWPYSPAHGALTPIPRVVSHLPLSAGRPSWAKALPR